MLDLTFFATGHWQHTFLASDSANRRWVYKTPAAFGYTLPSNHRCAKFYPQNACEHALAMLLFRIPSRLHRTSHSILSRDQRSPPGQWLARVLESVSRGFIAARTKSLAAYRKRMMMAAFHKMLSHLEFLRRNQLDHVVLPFKIVRHATAIIHVNGAKISYDGPMLIQERVDRVFESSESLDSFKWSAIVDAQHELWRGGIGISGIDEALGPKSWALHGDQVRLVDTSSLTRDLRELQARFHQTYVDRMESKLSRRREHTVGPDRSREYFQFVRENINQRKLNDLWKQTLASVGSDIQSTSVQTWTGTRVHLRSSASASGSQ